jgi:CubicO group peptidase (beta-lactamase class C family)
MNTSTWFGLLVCAWLAVLALPASAVDWVARHGLSSAEFQSEFSIWTAAPYNFRLVSVCGYEEAGAAKFAAVWEKKSDSIAWVAHHQMSTAQFENLRTNYAAQNLQPVFLSGFGVGGTNFFSGIWEYAADTNVQTRAGLSSTDYFTAEAALAIQGYKQSFLWEYTVGGTNYFNGIWRKDLPAGYTWTNAEHRTSAQYQQDFNAASAGGFELVAASGSFVDGTNFYTGLWRKPAVAPWSYSYHGLSAANHQAETLNAYYTGFRPVIVGVTPDSSGPRFHQIFHANGGMQPTNLALIDNAIRSYMQSNQVNGLSLAIANQGRLVYARGFGQADVEAGESVHPHHRFRIASVSKPFTAAAILKLDDDDGQGFSILNQTVFGGAFSLLGNTYGTNSYSTWESSITLRMLLNHTAGWTGGNPPPGNTNQLADLNYIWNNAYGDTHTQLISDFIDNTEPFFSPGTVFDYLNIGYCIAGRVIERLSSQTYEQYVKDKILAPCGVTEMELGGVGLAQRKAGEVKYYDAQGADPYAVINPRRMDAHGGWIAKPIDLLLFLRRINSDAVYADILSSNSMTQMRTGSGPNADYGLGTFRLTTGFEWGHNGTMAGSVAYLIQRNDGFSFAFALNTRPTTNNDTFGGTLRDTVDNLISTISTNNGWPSYNLFPGGNPKFSEWVDLKFAREARQQFSLQSFWSPDADPDGDGLRNAAEALFDTDPFSRNPAPVTAGIEGREFVVRWMTKTNDFGVIARPLQRTNLAAVTAGWQAGPAVNSVTNRYGTQVTHETRVPLDGRSSYFQTLSVAPQ